MGFDLDVSVSAVTVFAQGLLSFFSPCVLPLLPIYVGYLSGGTTVRDEEGRVVYNRKKVAVNTLFFVIGICFALFLLGLGMTAVGRFFGSYRRVFSIVGGILVILFGLYQLGAFGAVSFLSREKKLPLAVSKSAVSPVTALLMGFTFSFSWTPCIGPTLSSVLIKAASSQSSAEGFLLIGVYTLGFVIPFLAVGLFTASLLDFFKKYRNLMKYTVRIGGVIMIIMGILMVSGLMEKFSGRLASVLS